MSVTADLDVCTRVAVEFATKLIHGKYAGAHLLLSSDARDDWPPSALREAYQDLVDWAGPAPDRIEVARTLRDWKYREDGDLGAVYLLLHGGETEGMTVTVSSEQDRPVVREIDWGRT
ncbi:hypothetical protein E5843_00265 [Luteimonas yindakuii]|uniref:hypothetical protein n=1 Tax=Luteimonas yindakuii TaxID=2565782 RepID=UPI0010A52F31|nr:hypothetical protein [Luteimonas yindakuii]QCO66622.1 hypothetical protein E5843_00265 [Luteimonas yindakuii]